MQKKESCLLINSQAIGDAKLVPYYVMLCHIMPYYVISCHIIPGKLLKAVSVNMTSCGLLADCPAMSFIYNTLSVDKIKNRLSWAIN